jgi:hypothetical protein
MIPGFHASRPLLLKKQQFKNLIIMKMSKDSWSKIIHIIITILTAIATTVGVTSCTGHGPF